MALPPADDEDPMRLPRGGAELLLVLGSVFVLLLVVGVGELAVRTFSSLVLLGNSRDLFVVDAHGKIKGNTPNAEGMSFDQVVYTDEHGFRVPKGGVPEDEGKREAILILGDSIGFGVGVEEADTIAGLLRVRFATRRIYNSSVIGYATPDYRNVVDAFVPQHDEVRAVVLVYCLNDVSAASAQAIDRYLQDKAKDAAPAKDLTETLRSLTLLSDANDWLRARSKLYLFLRHHLLGTQLRDWKAVLRLYADDRSADVEQAVRDITGIAAALKQRAIPLIVVLAPFEYQLRRPDDPEAQIPQRKLGDLLTRAGVAFIDPRPYFDRDRPSWDYFLAYDSMHFSPAGHRVMANVIAEALGR